MCLRLVLVFVDGLGEEEDGRVSFSGRRRAMEKQIADLESGSRGGSSVLFSWGFNVFWVFWRGPHLFYIC